MFLSIFSSIGNWASEGLITSAALLIAGWIARKWLKKLFSSMSDDAYKTTRYVAQLADDVTDYLVAQFPEASWDDILDKVVDKMIEESEIDIPREKAKMAAARAINQNPLAPDPNGTKRAK